MALDLATRATGGYPADLRNGAGIKIKKVGLRADISLDLSQTQKLDTAPAGGLVPVQDPVTGLVQALDFSKLPTSQPADGSVGNVKAAAMPPRTVKSNLLAATAQQQDVLLSDFGAAIGLGISRADIASRVIPVRSFIVDGFYAVGDLGAGARYVRGTSTGLMAIQDAAGTWFNLSVSGDYNVGHFGAKGDGVTDDILALEAARNAIPASGGAMDFPTRAVAFAISRAFEIGDGPLDMSTASTKQNIFLRSSLSIPGTCNELFGGATNYNNVEIRYIGAALIDHVFMARGPICCGVSGLMFNGQGKATWAMLLNQPIRSTFEHLFLLDCYGCIRQDVFEGTPTQAAIGSSENRFKDIQGKNIAIPNTIPTTGADIGYKRHIGAGLDVNRDQWENCSWVLNGHVDTAGFVLRGCDIVTFRNCFSYLPDNRIGKSIRVVAPAGGTQLPTEIMFYNCPLYGRVEVKPNDIDGLVWNPDLVDGRGIGMLPYANGDAADPRFTGATDLNLPYGFWGYDDRGFEFGFHPQQRKFFGGYGFDAPASMFRQTGFVAAQNTTTEVTLYAFNLLGLITRSRPQNLGAFSNTFVFDRRVRMKMWGVYSNNTGSGQTATFRVGFAGANAFNTGGVTLPTGGGTKLWRAEIEIDVTASNKISSVGEIRFFGVNSINGFVGFPEVQPLAGAQVDQTAALDTLSNAFAAVTLGVANNGFIFAARGIEVQLV